MMGILIPSEAEYLTESTLTRKTSSEFLSDGAAAKEPKQLFTKNTGLC